MIIGYDDSLFRVRGINARRAQAARNGLPGDPPVFICEHCFREDCECPVCARCEEIVPECSCPKCEKCGKVLDDTACGDYCRPCYIKVFTWRARTWWALHDWVNLMLWKLKKLMGVKP